MKAIKHNHLLRRILCFSSPSQPECMKRGLSLPVIALPVIAISLPLLEYHFGFLVHRVNQFHT